jgi:hypothetical protein
MDVFPVTEAFRQVTPRDTGPVTIQHRFDEQSVIGRGDADETLATWQSVLDPVPLIVAERISAHWSAPEG